MENVLLNEFIKNCTYEFITCDENFAAIQKATKRLYKLCRKNAKMLFWINVVLVGTGAILYVHDSEIDKLKKDIEQLKSGEESEVKAE